MDNAAQTIRSTDWRDNRLLWFVVLPAAALGVTLLLAIYELAAVLGLLAIGLGVLLLWRPDFAVYLFVMGIYLNAPVVAVRFHGAPQVVGAAFVAVLAFPLAYHLLMKRQPLLLDPLVPWIFAFTIVQLAGVLVADHRQVAQEAFITTLTEGLILFGMMTNVIREHDVLKRVMVALVIAGALLGTLSVIQKVTNTFERDYGGFARVPMTERDGVKILAPNPRSVGPIGEKNYYGQFMLLLVPIGIATVSQASSKWRRMMLVAATLLCLAAVALTASRGAAIGFCVLLVALYALREISKRQLVLLVSTAVVFVLLAPGMGERMSDLFQAAGTLGQGGDIRTTDQSIQGRATEIMAAWLVFCDAPIIGVGPGNFPQHFPDKANALGFQIHGDARMAHCSYLEIAAENGILGLACFVAIFYVATRDLWRARQAATNLELKRTATAFLLVMIVLMVTTLFLSFAFVRYYWLLLALCSAAARLTIVSPQPPQPCEAASS